MAKKKAAKKVARKKATKKVSKKAARKARQQLIPDAFQVDDELEELIADHEEAKENKKEAAVAFEAAYDSLKAAMMNRKMTEYHSPHLGRAVYLMAREEQIKVKKEAPPDED